MNLFLFLCVAVLAAPQNVSYSLCFPRNNRWKSSYYVAVLNTRHFGWYNNIIFRKFPLLSRYFFFFRKEIFISRWRTLIICIQKKYVKKCSGNWIMSWWWDELKNPKSIEWKKLFWKGPTQKYSPTSDQGIQARKYSIKGTESRNLCLPLLCLGQKNIPGRHMNNWTC